MVEAILGGSRAVCLVLARAYVVRDMEWRNIRDQKVLLVELGSAEEQSWQKRVGGEVLEEQDQTGEKITSPQITR